MPYKVAAFYQFAALPDFRELREPLRAVCAAPEAERQRAAGPRGHQRHAGGRARGDRRRWSPSCATAPLFGGRLDHLELKFSQAAAMPFQRLKVRLKKEIVTLGDASADPTRQVGTYVEPADWNALIETPDTLVIDTRNAFEVALGTFEGAVDPEHREFRPVQGFRRAPSRSGKASADRDVLHRRHPLRKGQRLSARRAALPRSITSRAASCDISKACPRPRAAGAANVSCSTNASRSAMACGSGPARHAVPMSDIEDAQRPHRRARKPG